MKVSIIIPAHNEETMIAPTLEAVLAQDYSDFEVIVIDNASRDNTAKIASSFEQVRVLNEDRQGTMWACQRGLEVATGEILVRMDADCLPEKDWISRGIIHFKNEQVVGLTGPYDYYDTSYLFQKLSYFIQRYGYRFTNWLFQKLNWGAIMIGGNSFMRTEVLREVGGFNTDIVFYGDDTDVAKRLSSRGKIIFDSDLAIKSSGRRFRTQGLVLTLWLYLHHFLAVIFQKKSA